LTDHTVTVQAKNRITIPRPLADRYGIEPGQRLLIVDTGIDDEFTVRVIRNSYAGALTGVYGTIENSLDYLRGERESWD
jgi:AbrB family looped-hinge helix DNA binding protein